MKEYVIWATNPLTNERRPISEKVYDKTTNDYRVGVAKRNGWQDVTVQVINLNDEKAILKSFINTINL